MPFAVAFVALWCGGHSPRDILAPQDRKGDMTRKTKNPNWFGIGMDAWALAAESNMVIAQRLMTMAFGGPAAAKEAERMVAEKVAANMALGFDLMTGKHGSTPEQVMSGSLQHYSRRVVANRRRLAK
jgi:hypothetical protein